MRVAVCDDQGDFLLIAERQILSICKRNRIPVSVKCFVNPYDLIDAFSKNEFDLVLLDIDMPQMSGKECARKLRTYNKYFKLIFVTSYKDEVYTSFEYDISSFIPKTMMNERMESEFLRIYEQLQIEREKWLPFEIKTDNDENSEVKLPVSDIMYFECVNRKIYLHTLKRVYSLRGIGFEKLKENMSLFNFVEIHRLCIVNLSCIFSVKDNELEMDNNEKLPISRRNSKQVMGAFTEYLKKELM